MTSTTKLILADRYTFRGSSKAAENLIGQGGMGAVYFGNDLQTGETVAIKLLRGELVARDPEMVERFIREGEVLRRLNHPNIVKNLGAFEQDNVHYLVMEYVPGGSLRDLLLKKHRLSVQQTNYIALDLADALTRAHRLDILHRDIKPDNVLIADDGTPRLTDFGMARIQDGAHITQDGAVVGTLAYMAPELFEGHEADEKTDIWAFGVMLYEMLAGERPFSQEQPGQLINAILTHPIPDLEAMRPDIPTGMVDLVYRMLAKERQARIPSARLIGAEIEAIIRGGTTTLQPIAAADSTGRFEITPTPHPALPTDHGNVPNNLPAQPTAFVGRDDELTELQKLISDTNNRLVTLVAPGGMGKTRLAVALSEKMLMRFKDGVFFVALAPIENETLILSAIADAIGFTFGGGDPATELHSYLREKHLLLVMDNFEHVTNGANCMANILEAAPQVQMIVTSRERLRLRSEVVYEVQGMRVPTEQIAVPDALAQLPIVQLFLQSAHRVMPDFVVDETTAADVARICRLVDGLPLAVELAAAWLDMLSLPEIVTEIERSLDFLESNLRDTPERHRSIRAVFDYSWNLLNEDERDTFLRLSVFIGGFEREAAQGVANASLRTLTSLINKSLLQRDPNGRYLPHKLLRQYAAERFASHPARKDTLKAHAMYYAKFLEKIHPLLNSLREQEALEAVELELDNVRAAWQFALETQKWEAFDKVIVPLTLFYLGRSQSREGVAQFDGLIQALEQNQQQNTLLYWKAMSRQAWLRSRLGDYETVWQAARDAHNFFEAQGNVLIEDAYALNVMSYVRMMQGRLQESYDFAAEANVLIGAMSHESVWYFTMANMGYAQYLMGNYDESIMLYESILMIAESFDNPPSGLAYAKNNLGEALKATGDFDRACQLFQEAYDTFAAIDNKRGMAFTLSNVAGIRFSGGDFDGAHGMYERAYAMQREIGDRNGIGHSLAALGNVAITKGNYAEAQRYFEESLKVRRDLGEKRTIADSMADLGRNAVNLHDYEATVRWTNEAIALYAMMSAEEDIAYTKMFRAIGYYRMNRLVEAEADVNDMVRIAKSINNPFLLAQAYIAQGEVELTRGDNERAVQYYKEALSMSGQFGTMMLTLQLFALVGIADVYNRRGEHDQALRLVTLISLHPRTYIAEITERASNLMKMLQVTVSQATMETMVQESKSLQLKQIVDEILGDN
jgi:serine/threonine protein kinase/predicted ATPase/Tfp pilus assembly protein PilF